MGIRLFDRLRSLRHRLFHGDSDTIIETEAGRVYVRCMTCMLRTEGIETGGAKFKSFIAGDRQRHQIRPAATPALTPAVADPAEVEAVFAAYEDIGPRLTQHVH